MEVIILAIVPCVYGSVMHAHHVRELIIKKIVKHRHSIADGNAEGETLLFIEIRHIRNVTVWEDIYAKDDTTIIDGDGEKDLIVARAAQIRKEIEETTSDYDREKLQERLAKISGGVAVLKVGGASEVEVKEKKDRIDDALNATRAAVKEGVVAGGGVALLYAGKALDKLAPANQDQKVGIDIIRKATQAPIRQIVENAGLDGAVVAGKLLESEDTNYGFNAQNGEYTDLPC